MGDCGVDKAERRRSYETILSVGKVRKQCQKREDDEKDVHDFLVFDGHLLIFLMTLVKVADLKLIRKKKGSSTEGQMK